MFGGGILAPVWVGGMGARSVIVRHGSAVGGDGAGRRFGVRPHRHLDVLGGGIQAPLHAFRGDAISVKRASLRLTVLEADDWWSELMVAGGK
jgi:hypothetical protein